MLLISHLRGVLACPIIRGHNSNIITVKPGYSVFGLVETAISRKSLRDFRKIAIYFINLYRVP